MWLQRQGVTFLRFSFLTFYSTATATFTVYHSLVSLGNKNSKCHPSVGARQFKFSSLVFFFSDTWFCLIAPAVVLLLCVSCSACSSGLCSSIVLCGSLVFHPTWNRSTSFSSVDLCWIDCCTAGLDWINLCWNLSLVGLLTDVFLLDRVYQTDPGSDSGVH